MKQEFRKAITFAEAILQVIEDEINRRGRKTTFSALVNELFAERFAKELKEKELEIKTQQSKSKTNR